MGAPAAVAVRAVWHVARPIARAGILETLDEFLVVSPGRALSVPYALDRVPHLEQVFYVPRRHLR